MPNLVKSEHITDKTKFHIVICLVKLTGECKDEDVFTRMRWMIKMNKPFIDFTDQVCLITGAGSETGIGFSTAKILGSLGGRIAMVATTDRIYKRADELKTLGIDARGYIADLMDRDEVNAVMSKIAEDFGDIHVLINNAGMTQVGEEEDFTDILNVTDDRTAVTGDFVTADSF